MALRCFIYLSFLSLATLSAALPIFSTGKAHVALGDPLSRIQRFFPAIESRCGSDQNDKFIEAYRLANPGFISAEEVWFIFDEHILKQVDYTFSPSQFKILGSELAVTEQISDYFEIPPKKEESEQGDVRAAYTWGDYKTHEKATMEIFDSGKVRISFFNDRNTFHGKSAENPEKLIAIEDLINTPQTENPRVQKTSTSLPVNANPTKASEPQANRPANGTILLQTSQGHGELTIDNGSNFDAVVKLVSPQRKYTFVSVYIHAGRMATVNNVRPNTYRLIYAFGEGWNGSRNIFSNIDAAGAFDKLLTFVRSQDHYTTFKVTLHPVVGGNTQCISMSNEEFLAY
jgi:hypothetical protein